MRRAISAAPEARPRAALHGATLHWGYLVAFSALQACSGSLASTESDDGTERDAAAPQADESPADVADDESDDPAATDDEANDDPADDPASTDTDDGSEPEDTNTSDDSSAPVPTQTAGEEDPIPPAPGEATRVARLTHRQYDQVIGELLGISDGPARTFAPDARNGFAFETSVDLRADARLVPQYQGAAEELAARVVADAALLQRIVPCTDGSCASAFITEFGLKAFRRPLTTLETEQFAELFAEGQQLIGSGDAFADGVQLVVQAMLQAPQFLYRTEFSEEQDGTGSIALDDWEIASRLSFFIYDSMPDEALLDAARNGQLRSPEQVSEQVQRMLADPRASRKLVSFHEQAWQFARYSRIAPDPEVYPDAPSDMAARATAASTRFIQDVIESGGGLNELLSAPYAYADSALAPLYGVSAGDELVRIDFEGGTRKGYLMQLGFLAANAYSIDTDPIHRGLFVVRDLLCRPIPDPPANATETPFPEGVPAPRTTREEVSVLTGQADCVGCHTLFNPAGFAFEGFDAAGRVRSDENGEPLDTTGRLMLDGMQFDFAGASELVDALALSPEVSRCYTGKWLEFAYGRTLSAAEQTQTEQLAAPGSIHALVEQISRAPAFLSRTLNEVAP